MRRSFRKYAIIAFLLFAGPASKAQFFANVHYSIDFGSAVSIGRETTKEYDSKINPWSVSYYGNERYRFPSLRFRAAVSKPLNQIFELGFKTGAEVHYFEYDHWGGKETYFSFPFQAVTTIRCIGINKKWALFNSVAAGISLNKWNRPPMFRKTGFLGTADFTLAAPGQNNSIYYKIGFEYARRNTEYEFIPFEPNNPYLHYEKVALTSYRQLAFVSVGYSF